jgi:GNAT superfamily N-acetyltransferase
MIFREATIDDIEQISVVRLSVRENILLPTDMVTETVTADYLTERGKGWVCEIENQIVGFAIADLLDKNIWALFVRPDFEKRGIGKQLQKIMLDWYFSRTKENVWLGTNPNTRAEIFYRKTGWVEIGTHGDGEVKFEMTHAKWAQLNEPNP